MIGFRRCKVATLSGIKIPLDTAVFSKTIVNAIKDGWYEQEEASQLPRIIEPGERVLEIGGGIGYVSALVARDARTAAVRVFEANPLLIPIIENIHRINGVTGVEVRNGVLSHDLVNPTSKFYVRHDFWASSLVEKPWGYDKVIDVPNVSFQGELEAFCPSLIICDIEGGELGLFEHEEMLAAFTAAGLQVDYDPQGLIGRGLYSASKAAS